MSEQYNPIPLHKAQYGFVQCPKPYVGFVGGRGSGKSFAGAVRMMVQSDESPGLYAIYAPTYPLLRDSTLRSFLGVARPYITDHNKSEGLITLANGVEVITRSLDDPEHGRGPNLSGAWVDEASLVGRDAFDIVIGSLREGGRQGWLAATFTPKGRTHWTYDVFGKGDTDSAQLFHATTGDNPFLPATFAGTLRNQYTSAYAAQEIEGQFVDLAGEVAKREWFRIVDAAPQQARKVRAWDFASSTKTTADYTVGTLMCESGGVYTVAHVIRARVSPADAMALIRQTAQADGMAVQIALEQEPGSSGEFAVSSMIRALAGFNAQAHRPSTDKLTRAMPLLAQAQAGNVCLVRAPWNQAWLDEFAVFPRGEHDDQVDSASNAFHRLATPSPIMVFA